MAYLLRGALIEYKSDFLGPMPNVVIFQFNPEQLTRNIQIPQRPSGSSSRETNQSGEQPYEKISITAHFTASDQLNAGNPLAVMFGIGPQLAALEKMVYPEGVLSGLIGQALDAIGDSVSSGSENPTQTVPREAYPRILFIWGLTKVLPVKIDSMRITEQHFDNRLNPIQAEVSLEFSVLGSDPCDEDTVAKGALAYTNMIKDTQAVLNLANTAQQVIEIIPF